MATVTINGNSTRHAKRVAKLITEARSSDTGVLDGIWHWINGVASGIDHLLGDKIVAAIRAVYATFKEEARVYFEVVRTYYRLVYWLQFYVVRRLEQYVNDRLAKAEAAERRDFRYLVRLIYVVATYVLQSALRAVTRERRERQRAIHHAESLAEMRLRAMHGTIEREAASGYRLHRNQRVSIITRLLDYAITRNPALKDIVSAIVSGLLDLLAVDDPPVRFLLGFLITKVIDRLGIDKASGVLAGDLLKPILGTPEPKNLHDVIADISQRLAASDDQWAQFMENGGSQVEQAGRDWRDITGVVGNVAIVAFTAQAVADPNGWAKEIASTAGVAANDMLAAAAQLFREG